MRYPLIDPGADSERPIVASDLEGTLSSGVTVMGIHRHLESTGRSRSSRGIYIRRGLQYALRKVFGRDLRPLKNDWMRDLMACYGGIPIGDVKDMAERVVRRVTLENLRGSVLAELQEHLAQGRRVILVSGIPEFFLAQLLANLPGMEGIGTTPYIENGAFTGRLGTFNVGSRKVKNLRAVIGDTGRLYGAYGDTFSDLVMLEQADHPVAVHPDRELRREAETRGWRILEAD